MGGAGGQAPVPALAPAVLPPAGVTPPQPPKDLSPNMIQYWQYFYYVYYYYAYLDALDKGMQAADAAAHAQEMAPVFAYEQLKHMLEPPQAPAPAGAGASVAAAPVLPGALPPLPGALPPLPDAVAALVKGKRPLAVPKASTTSSRELDEVLLRNGIDLERPV